MTVIKIQWKEAVSGWGIVSSVFFHFFLLFLDFSCFLLWAWVINPKNGGRDGQGGEVPHARLPHAHPTPPLPSSCTPQWRTSSVWPLGCCASWPRTRRRPTSLMLRGPQPHSWSYCTPTMRAPVRGWAGGEGSRGEAGPCSSGLGGGRRLTWPVLFSAQPPMLLLSCSASPRTRTQITESVCLWSSPTPSSSTTLQPGRL